MAGPGTGLDRRPRTRQSRDRPSDDRPRTAGQGRWARVTIASFVLATSVTTASVARDGRSGPARSRRRSRQAIGGAASTTRSAPSIASAAPVGAASTTPAASAARGPAPPGVHAEITHGAPGASRRARATDPPMSPRPSKAMRIRGLSPGRRVPISRSGSRVAREGREAVRVRSAGRPPLAVAPATAVLSPVGPATLAEPHGRTGSVGRVDATVDLPPIDLPPLRVEVSAAAWAAALLREQGVERRYGVDLAATGAAGELRHQRIVAVAATDDSVRRARPGEREPDARDGRAFLSPPPEARPAQWQPFRPGTRSPPGGPADTARTTTGRSGRGRTG